MASWNSVSENDNNSCEWTDDECLSSIRPSTSAADTYSEAGPSRPKLVSHYVTMGFQEDIVVKAIKENGEDDHNAILEAILTYSALENLSPRRPHEQSSVCPSDSEDDIIFTDDDFSDSEHFSEERKGDYNQDKMLSTLVAMGFTFDDASAAIIRCGPNSSMSELADSISAAQSAKEFDDCLDEECSRIESPRSFQNEYLRNKRHAESSFNRVKKMRFEEKDHSKKRFDDNEDDIPIPRPMIGFSLPNDNQHLIRRKLPEAAIGPPYFYYENVALTPKGVWRTISRYLYDIMPEFVDSKHFCAANRKRGYIHNLPIENRYPLLPLQPRTIHEVFPLTKKWWPSWDTRTQLNCLQTCIASAKLTERIRKALSDSEDPPPKHVKQYVIDQCKKWNLVWVGLNKVAPLEPDEIELILGFPRDHTRGGGISRTERYRSLGNSFQVDTVAYHLSVLKEMYPNGINVLSLFSGIGGGEVALYRLGIRMKTVVSVEISEINRNILRGWWEETGQTGTLIDIADVKKLSTDCLEQMIHDFGGFDFVIGGSPCNNLAGSNRVSRDGLQGEHSSLFYEYFRILESVRNIMRDDL